MIKIILVFFFFFVKMPWLRITCQRKGRPTKLQKASKKHGWSRIPLFTGLQFYTWYCSAEAYSGGGVMGAQPPGPVKSMNFRGFSGPNLCWASPWKEKKFKPPPWTNSWLSPCLKWLGGGGAKFLRQVFFRSLVFL